jgi:hypothetical protein
MFFTQIEQKILYMSLMSQHSRPLSYDLPMDQPPNPKLVLLLPPRCLRVFRLFVRTFRLFVRTFRVWAFRLRVFRVWELRFIFI